MTGSDAEKARHFGIQMPPMARAHRPRSSVAARILRGAIGGFLAAMFLAMTACPDQSGKSGSARPVTSAEETRNNSDPQWVVRQQVPAKVAVVFVHGLFGDTIGTWTHKNGVRFFDLVAADEAIAGKVDILAFGYPSRMFASGSFDIQAAANALHARLEHHGILSYQKVVFVGHSMGGLIAMRELLMNRAVMPSVPVIVLLATPQEGADVARIAEYIARNPALSQLKPADHNELLQILNDDWRAWPQRPKVRCAYENKKTRGVVKVVEWSSSTRFCDASVEISADHIEIVKPEGPESLAVIVVTNALKEYVFNPALAPKLETPDFVDEGDRSVFVLTQLNSKQPAQIVNSGGSALQFSLVESSDRNALLLWPDRPQPLPANSRDHIYVFLTSLATDSEHQFKLRTDYGFDRSIIVRVPNLPALRSQQAQLTSSAGAAILRQLESGEQMAAWSAAPAEDGNVPEAVVQIVQNHVARELPEWPEGLRWVIAADVLNGLNWSGLAVRALRQAERAEPELVKQASVQQLAAVTAARSGEPRIFTAIDAPVVTERGIAFSDNSWLARDSAILDSDRLAQKLQIVPALQFYGLSLQGDLKKARGDVEGARAAYQDAAVIRPAPSVTRRLEVTGGWRTTSPVATGAASVVQPADTPAITGADVVSDSRRSDVVVVVRPSEARPEAAVTPPHVTNRNAIVVQPTPENN